MTKKSIKGLETEWKKIKSVVSDDTRFMCFSTMFLAYEIVEMNKTLKNIANKIKAEPKKWYEFWK